MQLPEALRARAPKPGELPAILALVVRSDIDLLGEPDTDADDIRAQWAAPGFDLARDALLITGEDDAPVAYAFASSGGTTGDVVVDPGARGRGLGTALLSWVVARAGEQARTAGKGPVQLKLEASERLPAAAHLLARAGFTPTRVTLLMETRLDTPVPAPVWPDGIRTREFGREGDDRAVYQLVQDAFADVEGWTPRGFDEWSVFTFGRETFDPELMFLAIDDAGTLAGAAMCFKFEGEGFVQYLAVARPWRRRGLGEALLRHALGTMAARGMPRATLYVDADNTTGATRLYERAGMTPAHRWDRWERQVG